MIVKLFWRRLIETAMQWLIIFMLVRGREKCGGVFHCGRGPNLRIEINNFRSSTNRVQFHASIVYDEQRTS
jgi:hypothetical protein